MAYTDLNLLQAGGLYSLQDPTEDPYEKLRNRVTVLLLSCPNDERGSYFSQELSAGRLKTQADIVAAFNISVIQLLDSLRRISYDLVPVNIVLDTIEQLSVYRIKLGIAIIANNETIPFEVEATA